MPVTKEYYNELYKAMTDLAGRYAPDIEILVNTINSYDKSKGTFSLKPYGFDPDTPSYDKIFNLEYFYEKTGAAAPDTANYIFKLFCARLTVMAFYAIYLQKVNKRLEAGNIKDDMSTSIYLGGGSGTIDTLFDAGMSECRLEAKVEAKGFSALDFEHKFYIFLDNQYLLNTATIEDVLSGNIPVNLLIYVSDKLKSDETITLNQLVQYIKQVVPFGTK